MRVTQGLIRAATVAPHRVATIDGDRIRNWRDVVDRVARLAGGLAGLVAPGDRIAILADNCDGYFEAWYAVPWAAGVLVPLNTRLALPELAFQLRDAGATCLIHGIEYAATAAALQAEGAIGRIVALDGEDGTAALIATTERIEEAQGNAASLAGIFYTGGTTGLPKGVMLSHGALRAMAANLLMQIDFTEGDVNFHAAPMFHLADIATVFATMAGGAHVFRRSFDVDDMLHDIAHHRVTHCFTVPTIIERMARSPLAATLDLSSLRYLGYGGASMPAASIALARDVFPGANFIQGYGQTEFPAATFLSPAAHQPGADPVRLRSCGQVCYGYDIRIVDEAGREVPRGTVGEIAGRGENMMIGYWNRPGETADVLRDGWIHTRDAGYMDEDGFIYITDRLKDMIVSGAENVYSIEVENALSWHPAVLETAVVGLPDPSWGERVHAIVVLRDDSDAPAPAELATFCRARIAGYKVPKTFEFRRDPFERSAAGKILKGPLRDAAVAAQAALATARAGG